MAKLIFLTMVAGALIFISGMVEAEDQPKHEGCVPFRWVPWPGVSSKGAIMVSVLINGNESKDFQLDTGAFSSYINIPKSADSLEPSASSPIKSLSLAGLQLNTNNIHINAPDINDGNTLGIAQLIGHTIVLDLKNSTLCIFKGETILNSLLDKFDWIDGKFLFGHMLTPGWVGQSKVPLLFDTGSAHFELYTSRANWENITYKSPSEAQQIIAGNVWGKRVNFLGAYAEKNIRVGNFETASPPLTFYREDDPDLFNSGGYYGVVGLSLFSNSSIAFNFDSKSPKLGIAKH